MLVISQQRAEQPDAAESARVPWPLRRKAVESSLGTVATLRDRTEVQALTGELESMTTLAEALRAQTHEHANRLHTVATLIELGREREALEFAVADRQESQRLTDEFVQAIDEPYLTSLLVGKAAQAHERGITLTLSASGALPAGALDARDLVTITGNLLDNAFDAAAGSELRRVWADFAADDESVVISIADSGPGLDTDLIEEFFRMGVSSKPVVPGSGSRGLGLALVRQAVARLGGTLEVDNDAGAIFTVTIPLPSPGGVRRSALEWCAGRQRPSATATCPEPSNQMNGKDLHAAMETPNRPLRVLVVDDEPTTASAHASFVTAFRASSCTRSPTRARRPSRS